MRKYFFISLAAVLIIGLLLSGCAKTTTSTTATTKATTATTTTQAATTPTTTTPTVTPQYGGTLKIISNPGVTNLGYPGAINGSNDGSYRQPALEELLTYDLKGSGKVVPWLATGWAYNSDFTTLTFTLQKGVKFHDGTPFNAAAAKFSLDLILNSTLVDLKTVSSIEAVDDYTLRLNLKTYDSALLISLASYLCPMVSPTAVQAMGKDAAMLHPVGTGPFKFVSYTRDVGIKYEKFTDYWQKGKPYLDALEFVFISDPVTQLASLKAGEAQILRAISTTDAAALKATGKYTLATQEMAVDCLAGDSAHPDSPYAKLQVRQAIAYAIDNPVTLVTIPTSWVTLTMSKRPKTC
jgi:peptide/nickel transport system substrate-binding protein